MVQNIKLNDGKQIPALAWGNGTGGIEQSGQKAIDLGAVALKAGILHIDTAQSYGTEAETQGAIDAAGFKRSDVWVTTKISGDQGVSTTPESIRANVEKSLKKLQTPPDLILIHSPFVPEAGKIAEFWKVLEDLVEDGTLKGTSLGVSNFRVQDLEAVLKVAKIKPAVNQFEYHPYLLTHLEPVLALQDKHGIVSQSYGPLTPILRHPGGPLKPVLTKISKRLNTDEAGVLLKWTIQKNVVAVTTSSNESRIKAIAGVYDLPELSQEEMDEIEKVGKGVHFRYYGHMNKDFPAPNLPDGK